MEWIEGSAEDCAALNLYQDEVLGIEEGARFQERSDRKIVAGPATLDLVH